MFSQSGVSYTNFFTQTHTSVFVVLTKMFLCTCFGCLYKNFSPQVLGICIGYLLEATPLIGLSHGGYHFACTNIANVQNGWGQGWTELHSGGAGAENCQQAWGWGVGQVGAGGGGMGHTGQIYCVRVSRQGRRPACASCLHGCLQSCVQCAMAAPSLLPADHWPHPTILTHTS